MVVREWIEKVIEKGDYGRLFKSAFIKDECNVYPEYTYGDSRIDFYIESKKPDGEVEKILMEVKGCTLEIDGVGILAFVIQMEGVSEVRPYDVTHPEFGEALEEAKKAGVEVMFLRCRVKPDELEIVE